MKNTALFVLSITLAAVVGPRPASADVLLDWGIRAGFSLARADYSLEGDPPSTSTRPAFGAFAAINLSGILAVQPEIIYLTQGGRWVQDPDGNYVLTDRLRSLHIPLLAKVRLVRKGKAIPYLIAGPAVDVFLSAKHVYLGFGELIEETDYADYLKRTNFSIAFGGGAEIYLGRLALILDVRYERGQTNLVQDDPGASYKTSALMILGGIIF